MKRDIRIYQYNHGTLVKFGRLRTNGNSKHYHDSVEDAVSYIKALRSAEWRLKHFYANRVFLIVEFFKGLETGSSEIRMIVTRDNEIVIN